MRVSGDRDLEISYRWDHHHRTRIFFWASGMGILAENIVEPEYLFLAWSRSHAAPRRKIAVISPHAEVFGFTYLIDSEDFALAEAEGFDGYPAFPMSTKTYTNSIVEHFGRRLPPRKRQDFPDYLKFWGIDPAIEISTFALLGYTGAQLPGDTFSVVRPALFQTK